MAAHYVENPRPEDGECVECWSKCVGTAFGMCCMRRPRRRFKRCGPCESGTRPPAAQHASGAARVRGQQGGVRHRLAQRAPYDPTTRVDRRVRWRAVYATRSGRDGRLFTRSWASDAPAAWVLGPLSNTFNIEVHNRHTTLISLPHMQHALGRVSWRIARHRPKPKP